ncbi:NAD(+) kinase [Gammaproteobacteria bacterium AB-CW1]|uniref:NAD kinase n=1 Tax=Natronospira elongata TaxID=3110268 RepID=A0AAP6JGR8_9GAMM|nr:NAD(+) kinase [Gammaproteobacteria bacterium AB-CW1]
MAQEFQHIGLVGKSGDQRVSRVLLQLAELLKSRGLRTSLDARIGETMDGWPHEVGSLSRLSREADLIIVVGGDGTLLNTARQLADHPVPLAGINLGRLGFLTDIAAEQASDGVASILDGQFQRDERRMLDARIMDGDQVVSQDLALNDVVVQKADGGRMIEFEAWVDDSFVSLHRADGMIAATATGSTAYALSGGGPILHPDVDSLALVPICPHTLSDRPLVLPGQCRIRFILRGSPDGIAQVNWDGQQTATLKAGQTLEITRSERITTLLHPPGYDYFALLRSKLQWGRAQNGTVPR